MTNYKIKKRSMVGGLSDASKSSKIKNRIFCEVDFLHVSQYNHVVSKSPKNPNLFYKPSFAPLESLPPITAKYSSDKTEKRGKFRNFEH